MAVYINTFVTKYCFYLKIIPYNQRKYILLVLFFATVGIFYAQSTPPNPNPPPPGLPINAGVFILSLAALAYGIIRKQK